MMKMSHQSRAKQTITEWSRPAQCIADQHGAWPGSCSTAMLYHRWAVLHWIKFPTWLLGFLLGMNRCQLPLVDKGDVLRKWAYFEQNFKSKSAFLKVGKWNKVLQTFSHTLQWLTTLITVKLNFQSKSPSHQTHCIVQNEHWCHLSHFSWYSLLLSLLYVP